MTITYKATRIECLSTDTKPSNQYDGRVIYETDTGKTYTSVSGSWVEDVGSVNVSNASTLGDVFALS